MISQGWKALVYSVVVCTPFWLVVLFVVVAVAG